MGMYITYIYINIYCVILCSILLLKPKFFFHINAFRGNGNHYIFKML